MDNFIDINTSSQESALLALVDLQTMFIKKSTENHFSIHYTHFKIQISLLVMLAK